MKHAAYMALHRGNAYRHGKLCPYCVATLDKRRNARIVRARVKRDTENEIRNADNHFDQD